MNHRYVVRVCTNGVGLFDKACENSDILDLIRDMGLVVIHRRDTDGMCFDILPPSNSDTSSQEWARKHAHRMMT